MSSVSRRGYAVKSSLGPNCVGLTKIDAIAASVSWTARSTKDMCPACSAPIVGTNPTRRAPSRHARTSETVRRTFTDGAR